MSTRLRKREALRGLSPRALSKLRDQATREGAFLEKIRRDYTEKYPHRWIAVIDSEVIGPAQSTADLLVLLRERGIDPAKAMLAYLDPGFQRSLLL